MPLFHGRFLISSASTGLYHKIEYWVSFAGGIWWCHDTWEEYNICFYYADIISIGITSLSLYWQLLNNWRHQQLLLQTIIYTAFFPVSLERLPHLSHIAHLYFGNTLNSRWHIRIYQGFLFYRFIVISYMRVISLHSGVSGSSMPHWWLFDILLLYIFLFHLLYCIISRGFSVWWYQLFTRPNDYQIKFLLFSSILSLLSLAKYYWESKGLTIIITLVSLWRTSCRLVSRGSAAPQVSIWRLNYRTQWW